MAQQLSEILGRCFEVGFNVGILNFIHRQEIPCPFLDIYLADLKELSLVGFQNRINNTLQITDPEGRRIVNNWLLFFLEKGFISGANFLAEYFQSRNWKPQKVEIVYYQCSFTGDNTVGENAQDNYAKIPRLLSQMNVNLPNLEQYTRMGEFCNADTLFFFKYRQDYQIVCLDLSVFSIREIADLQDLSHVEVLRNILRKEVIYRRAKSVFTNLNLDTGGNLQSLTIGFSQKLSRYLSAFCRKDKESYKLIQAAGYGASFYEFLIKEQVISSKHKVGFNIFGYTDRSINTLSVTSENLELLQTCRRIYQTKSQDELGDSRKKVLNLIKRQASLSFQNGREFIQKLESLDFQQTKFITHQESFTDFINSIDSLPKNLAQQLNLPSDFNLRQGHNHLVQQALNQANLFVFLTGNPGIGKTTALVEFLKNHGHEGFIFFYISPRTQVNLDIVEKFKEAQQESHQLEDLVCLHTNANILATSSQGRAVQYYSQLDLSAYSNSKIEFRKLGSLEKYFVKTQEKFLHLYEDVARVENFQKSGVLATLCTAISQVTSQDISRQLVVTIASQSLRKLNTQTDTLKHFKKLFKSFYNERNGSVIAPRMREFSRRYRHLFFMVDEITGDRSGVEFLNGITKLVKEYQLNQPEYGFNTKVIVADASIVDQNVIVQHLSQNKPEPDKIFYRKAPEKVEALSQQNFQFKNQNAILINTNSFPGSSLTIDYKILLQAVSFQNLSFQSSKPIINELQKIIARDISSLLDQPDIQQILVYIQDKRRLQEIIGYLKRNREDLDYLEIHASLSEIDKKQIQDQKESAKVVFMTASASRGLSFPKATHILVDVPRFSIEQNLMEIIQVIYRGRGMYREEEGWKTLDDQAKFLTFYLWEEVVYNDSEPDYSLQESLITLLDILIILRTAILTRIYGSGNIGRQKFMMIPIGGKSIFGAGDTFTGKMASFLQELKKESHRRPYDQSLSYVKEKFAELLGDGVYSLSQPQDTPSTPQLSYLSKTRNFGAEFLQSANKSFAHLLHLSPFEESYVYGSLIFVPIQDYTLNESYILRLQKLLHQEDAIRLSQDLKKISFAPCYPETLQALARQGLHFVECVVGDSHSLFLEQSSHQFDQYYAIPLFLLTNREVLKQYYQELKSKEPEETNFKRLMEKSIYGFLPIHNVLPIGYGYREFPFLLFKSYSLPELRRKVFSDTQLFMSQELNILNVVLSQGED